MSVWSLARNSDLANLCPPKKRISYVQIMINAVYIKHVQIQLLLINKKDGFVYPVLFLAPKYLFFVCLFFVFLLPMLLLSLCLEFFSVMPIMFIHVLRWISTVLVILKASTHSRICFMLYYSLWTSGKHSDFNLRETGPIIL